MRTHVCVYIIEAVAHPYVQNAPLERSLSIPGPGVISRLLSDICLLRNR